MHWAIRLEGGPRHVNHAAVQIGDLIYSFGGHCSGVDRFKSEPIDVHMLNTRKFINTRMHSIIHVFFPNICWIYVYQFTLRLHQKILLNTFQTHIAGKRS